MLSTVSNDHLLQVMKSWASLLETITKLVFTELVTLEKNFILQSKCAHLLQKICHRAMHGEIILKFTHCGLHGIEWPLHSQFVSYVYRRGSLEEWGGREKLSAVVYKRCVLQIHRVLYGRQQNGQQVADINSNKEMCRCQCAVAIL